MMTNNNLHGGMYDRDMATYVPGVRNDSQNGQQGECNDAPVVGFLYSVSRNGIGEYWPLHVGNNTIGKNADNEIQLCEASVSAHHAVISVKKMKESNQIIAYIKDIGSKNGIYLNKTELDYEGHACKSNDVITIGNAYKLLLILVNAAEHGLVAADNFMPVEGIMSSRTSGGERLGSSYERDSEVDTSVTMELGGMTLPDPGTTRFM